MIGKTLAHYRIIQELGSGGMGTVYLAEDTRLGRRIALKVLPKETAGDPERLARFEREARAVASLNHPNIVVLHSVEHDGGVHFLTMEHVTGHRLSALIPPGGMGLGDFFRLAVPLADAIYGAHKQGITHRDLKPDNVMVSEEGRLKVLDFGLAKLVEGAVPDHGATMAVGDIATREGKILGTAAYMSPEQAEAKPIDHRTDIFSLGVILFQMATGRRPFHGDSQMSTLTSVLRDTPPVVTELRAELPRHLGRVINRCLAKDPDRRYQTALDVRNELEELRDELVQASGASAVGVSSTGLGAVPPSSSEASASGMAPGTPNPVPTPYPTPSADPTPYPTPSSGAFAAPGRRRFSPLVLGMGVVVVLAVAAAAYFGLRGDRNGEDRVAAAGSAAPDAPVEGSVVVLPFENLGPPEDAYFAAGITDEITSRLAMVEGLSVLSRTSAVEYDKSGKTMVEIGRDLGVAYVLEGTVRWQKLDDGMSRVRVVAQLVRTADDTNLWSDRFERSMEEIFRIQSDIAEQVVEALGLTLLEPARLAIGRRPTDNLDAYHAYLRGVDYIEGVSFTREAMTRGIEMLERAVELDPDFLLAHVLLAKAHAGCLHFAYDQTPERLALATAELERVEELAPQSPWAAYARGYYLYWGKKELEPALAALEHARRELPGNADILELIGFIQRRQGRYEAALESLTQAAERDPRNARLLFALGETQLLLRRYDEALVDLDKAIAVSPDIPTAYRTKADVQLSLGDPDGAVATLAAAPGGLDLAAGEDDLCNVQLHARRRAEALRAASALPDFQLEQFGVLSAPLRKGIVEAFLGDRASARPWFEKARDILEAEVAAHPDEANRRGALGMALAGLGEREAAIREGDRALECYPATHDAWIRQSKQLDRLYIFLLLDEQDAAMELLERLLREPGSHYMSLPVVRMSPVFDALRDRPDFRRLVGEGA